jgi:actin-related protein
VVRSNNVFLSLPSKIGSIKKEPALPKRRTIMNSEQARQQAEAAFNTKEQARVEGKKPMSDYEAKEQAMREKSERLRALRLARDDAARKLPLR